MKRIGLIAALVLFAGQAAAQSLKGQIIGTWNFVVAEITAPDGKKSFPFGEAPKGILIFAPDGRFAQIHVASDVPKFASGNRLTGSAYGPKIGMWVRQRPRASTMLPAEAPSVLASSAS